MPLHHRSAAASRRASAAPRFGTGYRADLQGLRAVAVLLVLGYHAGLPFVPGGFVGVDVFFVLSGFLITGIVARELERTGRLSLRGFYARRIARIVPAATVALLFTAAATVLCLPITQWRRVAEEVIGSALYVSNWQFAASTDYLNAEAAASPLQHFWSLAVEEQYYLLWPALLTLALALGAHAARRGRRIPSPIAIAAAIMLFITVLSFVFSSVAVARQPEAAYFVTPTRLWELGIGSLLALAAPRLSGLPEPAKRVLSAGGLICVLGSGFLITSTTPFPGTAALAPVFGAAALIAGGLPRPESQRSSRFLGAPPLVWIGGISYSLYLWHWPLLIVTSALLGELSPFGGTAVVIAAIVPAALSTRYIETPLRTRWGVRDRPSRAFALGAVCIALSVAAALAILGALHSTGSAAAPQDLREFGAASVASGEIPPPVSRIPPRLSPGLADAHDDNPRIYLDGCHLEVADTEPVECAYGAADGPLVLLAGDSHAAQWFPALEAMAEEQGLRLVSMTKSSCPLADVTVELNGKDRAYTECAEWNERVREYIEDARPTTVFTSTLRGYATPGSPGDEGLEQGLRASWAWMAERGVRVVPLVDTPYMREDVPDCLAAPGRDPRTCATPRAEAYRDPGLEERAAAGLAGVRVLDLNDKICPGETCEPVIGGALVYRDRHHLSATYARTLAPFLAERYTSE